PVVAGRHQGEGENPAGEGLGVRPEALVDAAAALVAEKQAAAVLVMVQAITLRPPETPGDADEDRPVLEVGLALPALGGDPLVILSGDRNGVFAAAVGAGVTVPVLHDRQVADWPGHDDFHGSRTPSPPGASRSPFRSWLPSLYSGCPGAFHGGVLR